MFEAEFIEDESRDTFIVNLVDELLEEAIDEGAHFRGIWADCDLDLVEECLDDPMVMSSAFEMLRDVITTKLRECVADRKR